MDQLCLQAKNHIQYCCPGLYCPMPNGHIWICMAISDSVSNGTSVLQLHTEGTYDITCQLRDNTTLNVSTQRGCDYAKPNFVSHAKGKWSAVLWQLVWIQNNLEKEKAGFKLNRIELNREKGKMEPYNCNKSCQFKARKEWMGEEDGSLRKPPNPSEFPMLVW